MNIDLSIRNYIFYILFSFFILGNVILWTYFFDIILNIVIKLYYKMVGKDEI